MNREDIIRMAREAGIEDWWDSGNEHREVLQEHLERFAAIVASAERDELIVMFLEAHEGAKDNHNYWHVAANKIKEKK